MIPWNSKNVKGFLEQVFQLFRTEQLPSRAKTLCSSNSSWNVSTSTFLMRGRMCTEQINKTKNEGILDYGQRSTI